MKNFIEIELKVEVDWCEECHGRHGEYTTVSSREIPEQRVRPDCDGAREEDYIILCGHNNQVTDSTNSVTSGSFRKSIPGDTAIEVPWNWTNRKGNPLRLISLRRERGRYVRSVGLRQRCTRHRGIPRALLATILPCIELLCG